jgi:hypothetical protein
MLDSSQWVWKVEETSGVCFNLLETYSCWRYACNLSLDAFSQISRVLEGDNKTEASKLFPPSQEACQVPPGIRALDQEAVTTSRIQLTASVEMIQCRFFSLVSGRSGQR